LAHFCLYTIIHTQFNYCGIAPFTWFPCDRMTLLFLDSFTISFTDKEQAKAKLNDHLASTLLPHYLAKFERLMVIFNAFVQFKSCYIKQNHLFTLETFFVISMKQRRSFRLLSSVCSCWHQTLTRWPEALASQWVKHQIKKMIERKCRHKYYASVLDYSFSDLRLKTICCKLKTGLGLYTV